MQNYKEERPWGTFEVLYVDEHCKIKKIVVNPGQRLSLQYHSKRDEHWYVTEGVGLVTAGDNTWSIKKGLSTNILRLIPHRITNSGSENLTFIEVQTGDYFGEDDIVRLSDDYNR